MEESEDNMSSDCAMNLDSSLAVNTKSKKRSLVERELETSLTSRITSPALTEGSSTSRYGRARRLKTDTDFYDTDRAVSMATKSPHLTTNLVKTPIKSPHAYKMHAVNSPVSLESSLSSMSKENTIENQIENIYNANNSLSRFGSDEKGSKSPAKKFPKVYVRKDLIQTKEKEETITLIKDMFSPVKSSNKRLNTHLNNILERSSEKYNINGTAIEQNGFIDTSSVVKTLDFDSTGNDKAPKKSKDFQENKVILSKGELFELEAKCEYQVGDCAWARIGTFPFWPCIVTREPGTDMFVKKKLFGRVERDVIHVTFFGDNGRRSWVLDSLLRPFLGLAEFETAREQYTAEAKKKDPRLYAAFFVSDKKQSLWKASVEEAETLFKEPKRLRIDLFYDLLEKSRIQKITPKGQKSGRVTRTDSDVSLSESLYDSLFSEDDGKVDDLDRSKSKKNKPLDVSEVVTACLDNMAAKTGMTKIQKQSHMDIWLQKAKSKTPEKSQVQVTISVETVDEKIENIKENDRINNDKKKNKVISKEVPKQKPYRLRKSVAESQNLPSNHKNNEIGSTFENHIELLNANQGETNTTECKSDNSFQGNINNESNFDSVVRNNIILTNAEDQDVENDLKSKDKSLMKSSKNVRNKSVKVKVKGRRLTANQNLKNKVLESTEEQMLSDELKLTSEIELERSNNSNDDSKSVSLEPASSENLIKDDAALPKKKVLKKSKVTRVKKMKKKVSRKKKNLGKVTPADNEALQKNNKAVREVTPVKNEVLDKHNITKDNSAPSDNENVDFLIMIDKADPENENPPKNILSKDMADPPKEDMDTLNMSTDDVVEALDNLIFGEDKKSTENQDDSCNISKSFSDRGYLDDQNLSTDKADTSEFKDLDNNIMFKVKKVLSDNTATANCNIDIDTTAVSESVSLDNENLAIGEIGSSEHKDLDESIFSEDKAARSKDTDNCDIDTNKAAPSEKLKDPEFQRYVELKQDAIIDQHPQLTYDEIVEYLFNTWLYEQGLKNNDKNKDLDICIIDTDKAASCANGSLDNQYVNEDKSFYSLIETMENDNIALDKITHPENEKKNNHNTVEFVFGDDDNVTNYRDPESKLDNQTCNMSSSNIEQIDKDTTVNRISLESDTIKSECNDDSTYGLNLASRKKSKTVNKDKRKKISLALRKSPRSAPRLDSSFSTDNKQGTYCENNIPNEMNEMNFFPKETVGDCSLSSEKNDQAENLTKSLVNDEADTENRNTLVEEASHNTTELPNPETYRKLSDINTVTDCIEIESDDDDMKDDMDIETASINSAISDISITENEKLAFKTGAPAIIVNGFHGNDFVRKIKEEKINDSDLVSMSSECDNLALSELKLRSQLKDEKIEISNDIKMETPLSVSDTDNESLIPKDAETNFNDVKKVSKVVLRRIEDQVNDNSLSPRTRRILRPRMCNSPADVLKENDSQDSKSSSPEPKIKDEFDPDTISINSEDSNASSVRRRIRKDKETIIKEEKLKDPEFLTYIELKQDALMDQHPDLTYDEIVEYLFKTWLYEQGLKKNDDIDHSTLVKGSNEEVTHAKPVKKKIKTEKKVNTKSIKEPRKITDYVQVSPKDKPKRKVSQPFYAEDYSDAEEEIQLFEIFRKHAKPDSKPTEIKSLESIKVESNIESPKESSSSKIYSPKVPKSEPTTVQNGDIPGEFYDEEELYFEQLTQPKPNVFRGLSREKVCEICEKTSNLVKCKGCSGMFHGECVTKALKVIEISPPTRGRKKKKKGRGRKLKLSTDSNGLDSESQSDEKSQDGNFSKDNMSMDDSDCHIVLDADNFESKLEEKMKELLETKEDMTFDSYSSDEALDWNDTETGKCEIVDIKLKEKPVDNTDYSDFKCNDCQKYDTPICFVCKSALSPKNKAEMRQRCQVLHCNKYYHLECLDHWPQTQFNTGDASKNNKKNEIQEPVTCPRHVCHTCVCDDPRGCKTRFSGDKLARCIRCPATYHTFTKCLPAGTQILTGSLIICPRHYEHRPGKVPCHVNTGWCFICALGGSLICCEYCPTSFHAECLNIAPPDGGYMCEDCETGRLPLYGEMVWVKLGHYRWWPGIILHPTEIPPNILAVKHSLGEFVVRFFGQYDYYWVNRGRVFPFQEGDSGRISSQKSKIDEAFTKAMDHALRAFEILKNLEPNEEESLDIASSLLPPSYVKLKANKPCGALVGRRSDVEESSLTQCECNPTEPEPCGPYSQCLNRMLLTECGPSCRAGDRCQNRAFERREYPPLRPYRTPHRGWGLRTLAEVKAGQFVIEYVGELIDEEEFRRRMNRKHEMRDENFYFLTLDKERMIDAGPKGNLARFMNHCCEPNCETQKWTVLGDVRVGLFAINDIPANSEVTFNYNFECAGIDKKRCLCGAKRCSGYIGAKLKQDDPLPKKPKLPVKRAYKKRKTVEDSPSTSKNKPKRPVGRPAKPRELTEIEKDLLIIKNATNGISSDSECSGRLSIDVESEKKDVQALRRKRVSLSTEDKDGVPETTPLVKKLKVDSSSVCD